MDLETAQALVRELNLFLEGRSSHVPDGLPFHARETIVDGGSHPEYIVGIYDAHERTGEAPGTTSKARSETGVHGHPKDPAPAAKEKRARSADENAPQAGNVCDSKIFKDLNALFNQHYDGGEGVPRCYWDDLTDIFRRHGTGFGNALGLRDALEKGGPATAAELSELFAKIQAHKDIRRLIKDNKSAREILQDHINGTLCGRSFKMWDDELATLIEELGPTRLVELLRRLNWTQPPIRGEISG